MKLHKILLIAITAFALPFLGFIFLLKSQIGEISLQNYLAHSALLIIACTLAFYVSYRAYSAYNKNKDYRVFFVALAFYIYGFGFLIHGITVPGFRFINEGIFDFTEHFSLFFGSLIMLGLVLPFQGLDDWLFRHKKGLVFELIMLSVLIFIFLPAGFPARINNFSHYIDFAVVAPTGLLLLITLSFLIKKYMETASELLFYLIISFAVLINAAIVPLFYEEWGVLWWYFHFVFILSFAIILTGILSGQRSKQDFETAFGAVPLYAKIKGKLIAFILLISILPLIASVYFVFTSLKNNLQKQIANDLILVAESQEGQIFTYLETKKGRAIDFASDGFIRDAVQTIAGNPEKSASTTEALNRHLRTNKMSLDKAVYGINVIDLNSKIIASTDDAEIGKNESADPYFADTLNLAYGSAAVVSDMEVSRHFFQNKQSIMISAPLTDKSTGEKIGVMVNYYDISELNRFISGARQVELGALSGPKDREKTLDIYLVNKDKLMITASKFFGDEVFLKQVVNTEPVSACHSPQPKEISGVWKDYRDVPVYGASMCLTDLNWTLLVEIDQSEILQPLIATRNAIAAAIILIVILIIILAVYFSKSITKPLESLANVAEKIAKGNIKERVKINSRDEIGYLARIFNEMLDNIQKKDRFMLLIRDVVIDINKVRDINNAYQTIIDKICADGNWPIGHVYLKDKDSDDLISTKIWHLSDPEKFKIFKEVTEKTNLEKDVGLPGRILESKNPIWISDVAKDANFPRAKLRENINIGAAFGFPVVSENNQVIAIFEFFSAEPKEMEGEFFDVIKNIGSQINGAVEKIISREQLEEKIKERTAELMELKTGLEETVRRKTVDLEKKLDELEKFKELTIDRELKMIELKKEIETLKNETR